VVWKQYEEQMLNYITGSYARYDNYTRIDVRGVPEEDLGELEVLQYIQKDICVETFLLFSVFNFLFEGMQYKSDESSFC